MSVLKLDMTYQCTARCEHCRFYCTPDPQPVIDHDLAADCLRGLRDFNGLRLVVILGGEPGLYPDRMMEVVRSARGLGLDTRVETNGFWATSPETARRFLEPLRETGTQVMLSIDAFHAPFVPPQRVTTAVRTADELQMDCWVDASYVDFENRDNEHDRLTMKLVDELAQSLDRPLAERFYEGPIFYTGRSTQHLAQITARGRGVPDEPCKQVPWWSDGSLETLDLLNLDPDGYISKGCGIAIGNVKTQSVESIVKGFDPYKHPIFKTLLTRGPIGLAEDAFEFGYKLRSDYADRCHLCQESRQSLRTKYPDLLVPDQHYL